LIDEAKPLEVAPLVCTPELGPGNERKSLGPKIISVPESWLVTLTLCACAAVPTANTQQAAIKAKRTISPIPFPRAPSALATLNYP
jgi:hypothetical protein